MVLIGLLYLAYLLYYPLFFGRKIGPSFCVNVGVSDTNDTIVAHYVILNDTVTFTFLRNRTYEINFEVANDGTMDLHDITIELIEVPQGFVVNRLKLFFGDESVGSGSGNSLRLTTPLVSGDYLIKLRISSVELERSYSIRIVVT